MTKRRFWTGVVAALATGAVVLPGVASAQAQLGGGSSQPSPTNAELQQQCDAGQAVACNELAYRNRDDWRWARALVLKSCELGNIEGCHLAGGSYTQTKEMALAVKYFSKSCDAGFSRSCTRLGEMYYKGEGGLIEDKKIAGRLLSRYCDKTYRSECLRLGDMYYIGEGGLLQDRAKAAILYDLSCRQGIYVYCHKIGEIYYIGEGGVSQNKSIASELFSKACRKRLPMSCVKLGMMYSKGDGVTRNDETAVKFLREALSINPNLQEARNELARLGVE